MKNIIILTFSSLLLWGCSGKNNVEITGEIKNADKQPVYLEQLNVDNKIVVDSTKTNRKGHFSFKTNVTGPTFYSVRVGKESMTLLAEPDKEIRLSGDLNGLGKNYWPEGSDNSLLIKVLNTQLNSTQAAMDSLRKAYVAIPAGAENDLQRTSTAAEWDSLIMKQIRFSRDFVLQHAISPVSYYALYQKIDNNNFVLAPETDLQSYKIVFSSMKAMYPESQYTKALEIHYDQIMNGLKAQQIREMIVNSENDLPEINLPNIKGDTISLRSLKGKYIILDFIVLGTPESRAYINGLKDVYNKYRNKGVEIYQVCLDQNQLAWEELVRQYGINWTCVRDAESLNSRVAQTWNVQNIPANYIIGKDYDIVGKNLNGRRLEDRLKDIIK